MQAVPSVVGSGTVVAAAAVGLVFGQPSESTHSRPSSNKRKLAPEFDSLRGLPASSRPGTSATAGSHPPPPPVDESPLPSMPPHHPQPLPSPLAGTTSTASAASTARVPRTPASGPSQLTPPKATTRRHSFIRPNEWAPSTIAENARDSVSSNGSWMRRLSIRPLSQHGSPRSSVGPDSPSLTFSYGSGAAILSTSVSSTPPQLPPNKLVKRTTTTLTSSATAGNVASHTGTLTRRGSRSQMPSLRRPATSHQRSATLQQVQGEGGAPGLPSGLPTGPKYSLDQQIRPSLPSRIPLDVPEEKEKTEPRRWTSFFHSRVVRSASSGGSPGPAKGVEDSPANSNNSPLPSKRIHIQKGSTPRAYLISASMLSTTAAAPSPAPSPAAATPAATTRTGATTVTPSSENKIRRRSPEVLQPKKSGQSASPSATASATTPSAATASASASAAESASNTPEETPSKRARRSISMHFTSPSTWISKSGSIRRQKRGAESKSGGIRNVSAPVGATSPIMAQGDVKQDLQQLFAPPDHLDKRGGTTGATGATGATGTTGTTGASSLDVSGGSLQALQEIQALQQGARNHNQNHRQRNSSSPLPPLSRLSSFNVDLYRLGSSTSAAAAAPRRSQHLQDQQLQHHHLQASPVLTSHSPSHQGFSIGPHSRDVSNERASTLAGSDLEMRAFMSGDDDDTDFKSDTMFDSIRTTGSGRIRNVDTPLESMFDESPPSTAGNSKTKRLSIQEILGRSWDGDTRIMEEDEGVPTPIRGGGVGLSHTNARYGTGIDEGVAKDSFDYENHAPNFSLAGRDFGRLSLDDDDDYDWARDEETGVCNHLSPPSSSINSRVVSPNLRLALSSISGNGSPESSSHHHHHHNDAASERPRSTLFDWSEPPSHERLDLDGHSPRPKTVHGKQESDVRGGRAANRKGPSVAHVRSQSVPVVPEPSEANKAGGKFRTWASGPKNASEDWEEDFDFDEGVGNVGDGKASFSSFSMVVPASIQATQPTVKAHSGQIRELSLLVNGLKRLCRHGRDLHILDESPHLWKEAENIIELASPDEEEEQGEHEHENDDVDDDDIDDESSSDAESVEFDTTELIDERFVDEGFDGASLNRMDDDDDDPFEMPRDATLSRSGVVRDRGAARRRSVFSPEDDIFGGSSGWPLPDENNSSNSRSSAAANHHHRPQTPPDHRTRETDTPDSAMIASVMEAMQQQRRSSSAPVNKAKAKTSASRSSSMRPGASAGAGSRGGGSNSKLFFDTNSLQELVKRANTLFHSLSDMVRRAELLTQSPACTPTRGNRERHLRRDGSPAFTRVFTDPSAPPALPPPGSPQHGQQGQQATATPPMRGLIKSHSNNSALGGGRASIESRTSSGIGGQRMQQVMTVN